MNDREILQGFGRVSTQLAKEKADREYEKFQEQQRKVEDTKAAEELTATLKALEKKVKPPPPPKQNRKS